MLCFDYLCLNPVVAHHQNGCNLLREREELENEDRNLFTGHGSYNIPQMLQMVNLHVVDALPEDSYPLKKWEWL